MLGSYIRKNAAWIGIIFLCQMFMIAFMVLNGVKTADICYSIVVCLTVFFICFVAGVISFGRRYRELQHKEATICTSLDGINPPKDLVEEEWSTLSKILFHDRVKRITQMEKNSRDRKEYYTMWVHQIKTPIAALKLLLQEKGNELDLSEEKAELFRVEQYVEMALSYSRLESDSTDFVLQKTNLDKVIRESVRKYAMLFIKKKIALDYQGTKLSAATDEKWLGFVIEQILSNAVKYTKTGMVTINVESTKGAGAERIVIEIKDTGIGISAEDLPRIFEQGYTGYNGRIDKSSTGIGLFLCRQILTKLGHEIQVESEEGKGTIVRVKIMR